MPENSILNKRPEAENTLKKFVTAIYQLLECGEVYSFIIGAGNSGLAMAEMTKLIYNNLGKEAPTVVCIPFYRDAPDPLEYVTCMAVLPAITESDVQVLFVDDEIGNGVTAETCLKIISQLISPAEISKFTIVAEDHVTSDAKKRLTDPRIDFQLYKPQKPASGFTSVMSCIIPTQDIVAMHTSIGQLGDGLHCKNEMNILLGVPAKSKENGRPLFSYRNLQSAEKAVHDLGAMKSKFSEYLENLIAESISDLQRPKSKLPDNSRRGTFNGF